jgi:hypothetical protein
MLSLLSVLGLKVCEMCQYDLSKKRFNADCDRWKILFISHKKKVKEEGRELLKTE